MPNRSRRKLSSIEEVGPITKSVNEANKYLDKYPLPRLLNRKRWTKKQWKRHKDSWAELDLERRKKQRQQSIVARQHRVRSKRVRHHKILRDLRKSQRRELLDQRQGRKIRSSITQEEHSDRIIVALKGGATTVGQICKKAGLETRQARRCLRKLVESGNVEKPSSRQYQLTKPRQRRHLSDVQPVKRRRRLTKKSKAR